MYCVYLHLIFILVSSLSFRETSSFWFGSAFAGIGVVAVEGSAASIILRLAGSAESGTTALGEGTDVVVACPVSGAVTFLAVTGSRNWS